MKGERKVAGQVNGPQSRGSCSETCFIGVGH